MIGAKAKAYRETNTFASPTWSEVKRISDATLTETPVEASADDRGSRVQQFETTQYQIEFAGKIRVDPNDANYVAIRNAHAQDLALDMLILNGANDVVGSEGCRGWFKVFAWSEPQEMAGVLYRDFTMKPCPPEDASETHVQKAIISAGPTLTTYDYGTSE